MGQARKAAWRRRSRLFIAHAPPPAAPPTSVPLRKVSGTCRDRFGQIVAGGVVDAVGPEALDAPQQEIGAAEFVAADDAGGERLGMTLEHRMHALADVEALLRQADVDGAAVVQR